MVERGMCIACISGVLPQEEGEAAAKGSGASWEDGCRVRFARTFMRLLLRPNPLLPQERVRLRCESWGHAGHSLSRLGVSWQGPIGVRFTRACVGVTFSLSLPDVVTGFLWTSRVCHRHKNWQQGRCQGVCGLRS